MMAYCISISPTMPVGRHPDTLDTMVSSRRHRMSPPDTHSLALAERRGRVAASMTDGGRGKLPQA
jgi:hypothetical protein